MTKELEALEKIGNLHSITKGCAISYTDEYKVIKQALLELQAIKEAKPSEAMGELETLKEMLNEFVKHNLIDKAFKTIKQCILKAQKDEKLKVDICEMFGLDNLFPYNDTDAILKELEEYMDRHNELWVDFMKTSKELQAIKNAEQSEALISLRGFKDGLIIDNAICITKSYFYDKFPTIENALLKADKLEKAWEIVKGKNVDIEKLKYQLRIKDDDVYLHYKYDLRMTREEFDLLKEMLK